MSFSSDVKKWHEKTLRAASLTLRGTALELASSIITRTPVGNPSIWQHPGAAPPGYTGGRARGNWQVGINHAAPGTVDTKDALGSSTENKANAAMALATYRDAIYITNNLDYIGALENGHSTQAPAGMVAVTVRMFKRLVDRAARKAARAK